MWNTSLAAKGALAQPLATPHRLQNPIWPPGGQKWPTGSGKLPTCRFLVILCNFRKISFLIRALLLWEKVTTEEKKKRKDCWKYWPLRHCQQSTARTPTAGTPHARAKRLMIIVATTSLPAVDRPNANRWNADRSCQNYLCDTKQILYDIGQMASLRSLKVWAIPWTRIQAGENPPPKDWRKKICVLKCL